MLAATRVNRAFSLIELVIVVVIIGIIAAIAIPRMSRGAAGAADSSLTANLAVLRNSIDLYQTEHGGTYRPLPRSLPSSRLTAATQAPPRSARTPRTSTARTCVRCRHCPSEPRRATTASQRRTAQV
jgi:prepilin-type N-terminal cleavage/methylation domain-containing protein